MPKFKSTVKLAPRNCLEDEEERPARRERCPSGTKGRPSCHRPTIMAHQVAAERRIACSDPYCLRTFSTMKHMKRHLKDRHQQAYDRLRRCWKLDTKKHAEERKRSMADDRYAQRRGLTERTSHRCAGLRAPPAAPCPRVPRHPSTHSSRYDVHTSSKNIATSNRDVRWLPTAADNPLQQDLDERNNLASTVRRVNVSETIPHANFGSPPEYFSRGINTTKTIYEDKSNQTCLVPVVATVPKPDIFVIHGNDGTITISDEGILRDETVSTMIKVVQDNPAHNIPQNIRMFIRMLQPGTILSAVHQRDLVIGFRLLRAGLTTTLKSTAIAPFLQATLLPNTTSTQTETIIGSPQAALVPPLSPHGAWVEPGQGHASTGDIASLPSDEACEKVGSAGEPLADTHEDQPLLPSDEACEDPSVAGEQLADAAARDDPQDTSFNISLPSLPSVEACGGETLSQLITPSLTPLGAWEAPAQQEDHDSTSTEDFEMIELPALDDMALD